jgi:hypothetical protein
MTQVLSEANRGLGMHRLGFLLAVLLFCVLIPIGVSAQDFGPLDGTWQGQMKWLDMGNRGRHGDAFTQRIIIQGQGARVFRFKGEQTDEITWDATKEWQFQVQRKGTNAVISAINSGRDDDGLFVETWVFALTQKDRNTLISSLLWVMNNNNLPLTKDYSKFSLAATGELQRVSP